MYDLGSALSTKWTCKYDWVISSYNHTGVNASGRINISLSSVNGRTSGSVEIGNHMGIYMNVGTNRAIGVSSTSNGEMGGTQVNASGGDAGIDTYFVEMIRNENVFTVNFYPTDSDRTAKTNVERTGTLTTTGVTGLQYFRVVGLTASAAGFNSSSAGTIDNLIIYDNSITEVPATWTMEPTFEDNFSSDNFTDGGGGDIGVSGGSLAYDCSGGTTNSRSYYDLGEGVSESAWILRWKQTSTTVANGSSGAHLGFGISSITGAYDTSQNGLSFVRGTGTTTADDAYYLNRCTAGGFVDNGGSNKINFATSTGNVTNQVYYVELKRTSATTIVATIFSDAYVTSVESETFTDLSGVTGLRYLKCASRAQNISPTNTNSGTIDDVTFYNGVTTIN